MATLLVLKEHLKTFYSRYEAYIVPVLKFLAAFVTLQMINSALGYMTQLNSFAMVLIVSLLCSFMPLNFIIVAAAGFVLGHIYKLSLECAVVMLVLFLLLFLLYFRFSPKDTIVVVLTPVCFLLKIPCVVPLAMGLIGGPASIISVSCGVIVYYAIHFIGANASAINSLDADGNLVRFRYCVDGLLNNKAMLIAVIAFAATVLLVYVIRRLPVDHCWTIAMIAGVLMNIVILMFGDLKYNTNLSIVGTILGSAVAIGIVKILQFFVFNVDYSRTEHIQYEDDEYYYYVKAVPKMSVTLPDKTVTNIDTRKPTQHRDSTHPSNERINMGREAVSGRTTAAPQQSRATTMTGQSRTTAGTGQSRMNSTAAQYDTTGSTMRSRTAGQIPSGSASGTTQRRTSGSTVQSRPSGTMPVRTGQQGNTGASQVRSQTGNTQTRTGQGTTQNRSSSGGDRLNIYDK